MTDVTTIAQTEEQASAEAAFYRVVDGVCADLCVLRAYWPNRTAPEVVAAEARLARREAPGGDSARALEELHRSYGGAAHVPAPVRHRLEAYVEERLGRPPWAARDPADALPAPAVNPRRRRMTPDGR
jgi:hypothetical protein